MGAAIRRKAFDGGDGMALGAEGRDQAAMDGFAIKQHRAGAAVAGVAALLDSEMPELTHERPQTLSGLRGFLEFLAVDLKTHGSARNSLRISSASRSVMCLRHSGLPWTSV